MNSAAPDYQMVRNYLDLLLDLPWEVSTEDQLDLNHASEVLDEDHYGLDKIKERILEQLAVLKLNPEAKAPILLFVGPPGVGKTSLGKSIARALGRKFERFSLGGMHDESELRGHRRTYIGAMPGRIIQAMRRAEANNPVLMLDEVDKLGRDYRGDPASALLEVLDPNQNTEFYDNYVGLPFDLSKTFFILTANALDTIPTPLLDRMEIIQLTGYSEEEKLEIAKRYLVERQRKDVGLTDAQFQLPDDTLKTLISRYTREAGVRNLERIIGRVARKLALKIARDPQVQLEPVTPSQLEGLLGPEKFLPEQARKHMPAGVAAGMAWTPVGGDILYIEAIRLPKGEGLHLTGQLGDVMKESAQTAHAWVQAQLQHMGFAETAGRVHIHVPAGAVPKDGPSAGVTMATAMMSLYTQLPVRQDTAMTGEITLTGLVLPVGGIKEKVLAAHRAGLRQIILPKQNERDLADLPAGVRADLKVVLASDVSDVLRAAIPDLPALT
jgi:ATP-dependent Lon protease